MKMKKLKEKNPKISDGVHVASPVSGSPLRIHGHVLLRPLSSLSLFDSHSGSNTKVGRALTVARGNESSLRPDLCQTFIAATVTILAHEFDQAKTHPSSQTHTDLNMNHRLQRTRPGSFGRGRAARGECNQKKKKLPPSQPVHVNSETEAK